MRPADRYGSLLDRPRLRDRPLLSVPRIPSELELQARWFAGDFGRDFQTTAGERLKIIQFGFWNREAGPDFREAAVQIEDREVAHGDIEIDLLDRNWESHGHATSPAFDRTVLHIFAEKGASDFFTRTSQNRNVPQIRLDLTKLNDTIADVAVAHAGRCVAPLKNMEPDRVMSILEAAAQFRLRRKTNRFRQRMEVHGRDETLFQAMGEALGYKQNRLAFTLLTQRLPMTLLRRHAHDAEAMLFGVASFLNTRNVTGSRPATRTYLRSLWDRWWKHREQFTRLCLSPGLWKLGGARPANHPQRRLGALAALLQNWKAFSQIFADADAVARFLSNLRHDFWSNHYTLTTPQTPQPIALIGDSRVADILANVIYPFALTDDHDIWNQYRRLAAQLSNQSVRIAAARLFATDIRQHEFLRTVAGQQGLLQIYEDFCLRDASDCAQCPFPEQVLEW